MVKQDMGSYLYIIYTPGVLVLPLGFGCFVGFLVGLYLK
jgi:hypothetical protein